MSGHSKWANIKYKKEAADKKRGQLFSKLARQISIAAKEGGGDPEKNNTLRMIIDRARSFNMPKENIERAIKRGTGEIEGVKYERATYEAFGPGNTAIIIEVVTDNKNRTLSEVKQALNKNGGKIAQEGSLRWMFERKGVITINVKKQNESLSREDLELKIIEADAENFRWVEEDYIEVYVKPEDLEKVKKNLTSQSIIIEDTSLDWVAKEVINPPENIKEKNRKLFEILNNLDSVQEIYSNINF